MEVAVVVGVVATIVALVGLLGRSADGLAKPSQIAVMALPLGIIAGGYAASIGASLVWILLAVVSVFLAVLAGSFVGVSPAVSAHHLRPASAGLSLTFSGLIALGMAAIVIVWASHLISAFSFLNGVVLKLVLVLAAVAFGIGGRGAVGLSRLVLVLLIVGGVGMFAIGIVLGDPSGLTAPEVPVPSVSPVGAIVYAVAVVLIGAGLPVLREASDGNRRAAVIAGVVLALVTLISLVGMASLYGGAFQLPSLVINIFPVFTPVAFNAVFCGLVAIISTVTAGASIQEASRMVAAIQPKWYEDIERRRAPRRRVAILMGVGVFVVTLINQSPTVVVALLGVLGAANLVAEWTMARAEKTQAAEGSATSSDEDPGGGTAGTSDGVPAVAGDSAAPGT